MPITYEKVLCAVNITESAQEVIKHAASIAKRYKAALGSTAERVLHKAPCPVLMVPLTGSG